MGARDLAELAQVRVLPYSFRMPARVAALAASFACAVACVSGCNAPGFPTKRARTVRPSGGEEVAEQRFVSPPLFTAVPQDAIVRIVGPAATCTGTLIDEDLVLTAHHCVVERGPRGEFTAKLLAPSAVTVELGGDDFAWGEVNARAIVAPPCGEAGGRGDVAVLVLTRKLVGVPVLPVRSDTPPRVGEAVHPVGFGRCALSAGTIHRRERMGGAIRTVAPSTLEVDASICPGDSGGPVLAGQPRTIVGIVSLSAMDHDERTRALSIMTRIDAHRSVLQHASLVASGMAENELPPLECP